IPKKRSNKPEDFRPITVSSLMYRCYTASLTKHLGTILRLSQFQKGFVDHDGISETITTVKYIIKNYSSARIASLDVSKAFDNLNQEAIFTTCQNRGLDSESISILRDLYRGCTTMLSIDNWRSAPIIIKNGVK